MAQNVTIAGNQYPSVPAIDIPKTSGGGVARFVDPSPTTATDADVASGKIYFKADGTQSVGTGSGGGGWEVIAPTQVTDTAYDQGLYGGDIDLTGTLVVGEEYIVFFDTGIGFDAGVQYTVTAVDMDGVIALGEGNEMGPDFSHYPFCIVQFNGGSLLYTESAGYYATSIFKDTGSGGGVDLPTFTATLDGTGEHITNITCDKTFAECLALALADQTVAFLDAGGQLIGLTVTDLQIGGYVRYSMGSPGFSLTIDLYSGGSIEWSETTIPQRDSSDLTVSGAIVNVPAGMYEDNASKAVASGSATPAFSLTGTSATVSTGTNTLTLTKTISNTPQVSAGYIASGTSGNTSVSLTANVTTQAAQTIYPSTTDQTISSGRYLTGTQTLKGVTVSGLSADKVLSGTTVNIGDSADADRIMSVSGSVVVQHYYTGSSAPSSSLGVNGDIYLKTS